MNNFAFEVLETALTMRRSFGRRAAHLGATQAQWRVLARLSFDDGARQVDVAEALDIQPITLSRTLDRLESAGLVQRRRDQADRRTWRVYLTAKSRPTITDFHALASAFSCEILAGISDADRARAAKVLAQVRENLGTTREFG
jgi:MarR family transcriptional regulator for hemolysin